MRIEAGHRSEIRWALLTRVWLFAGMDTSMLLCKRFERQMLVSHPQSPSKKAFIANTPSIRIFVEILCHKVHKFVIYLSPQSAFPSELSNYVCSEIFYHKACTHVRAQCGFSGAVEAASAIYNCVEIKKERNYENQKIWIQILFLIKLTYPSPHVSHLNDSVGSKNADELCASFSLFWMAVEIPVGSLKLASESVIEFGCFLFAYLRTVDIFHVAPQVCLRTKIRSAVLTCKWFFAGMNAYMLLFNRLKIVASIRKLRFLIGNHRKFQIETNLKSTFQSVCLSAHITGKWFYYRSHVSL